MAFSLFGSKGSYETDPYGALNPEQKTVMQSLGPKINTLAMNGAPTYTGDYTSPYTQVEQENLNREARLGAMSENWANQFQPGQINPEVDVNERRNLEQMFYGTGSNPGAKALAEEQYAGSGGYWGTPRAQGVMNAYNEGVVNPYQNWRSQALQNSYQNSLNYMSGRSAQAQNVQSLAQIPRLIQDTGLQAKYNEWVRGQNMSKAYVDDALNFLNISSATTKYTPGQKGAIGDIGALAGGAIGTMFAPGVGTAIGAQLGGGLGGMFDESGSSAGSLQSGLSNIGMNYAMIDALKGNNYNYTGNTYNTLGSATNDDLMSRLNALNGKY